MNNAAFPYILKSVGIILAYPKILIICGLVSFFYFADYIRLNNAKTFLFSFSIIAFLFLWPIIYGRYTEIINEEKHVSYWELFKKYWLDYYLVSLVISFPLIIFMVINIILSLPDIPIIYDLIAILINILSIYVIPLVFLTQKRLFSIQFGLKCIIGNFNFSWFLIMLTIITFVMNEFFNQYGMKIFNGNMFITAAVGSILSFVFIIVDFIVFISASLILKEKVSKFTL